MVSADGQRYLFPELFFAARQLCRIGQVDGKLGPVARTPIGDSHHLPGVESSHLLRLDDSFLVHGEAPVVGAPFPHGEEIGLPVVGGQHVRGANEQIRFEHIRVGKMLLRDNRAGDVVGLVVCGVLQELDHRVLRKELVELPGEVAAYHVDFLDVQGKAGVNQAVDDPCPIYLHERLGGVEGDGREPCAEARSQENGTLDPVRFKRIESQRSNGSFGKISLPRTFPVHRIDASQCIAGQRAELPLAEGSGVCRQAGKKRELFLVHAMEHTGCSKICQMFTEK